MKRALVLGLFVVLGAALVGTAQFQGEWDTWLKLDPDPSLSLESLYTFLDLRYLIGGWTIEAATIITSGGPDSIWFEAYGSAGPLTAWSLVYFPPTKPNSVWFEPDVEVPGAGFETGAEVSIAGVDIFALFGFVPVSDWFGAYAGGFGTGFALGGIATTGAIRIGAEVTWNLWPDLWWIFLYGLYGGVTDWTHTLCASDVWYPYWGMGMLRAVQTGCDVVFSYVTGIAEFPICCADVYLMVELSHAGVDFLSFLVRDIAIGLDWLKIYELAFTYAVESKDIGSYLQVAIGEVACFVPYLSVDYGDSGQTEWMLDGVTLNALTMGCDLGGCELCWGHIFDRTWTVLRDPMWPTNPDVRYAPWVATWYFEAVGGGFTRRYECAFEVPVLIEGEEAYCYPDEMVALRCDEDSCCCGLLSFSVNSFFNAGETVYTRASHIPNHGDGQLDPAELDDTGREVTGLFGWMGAYIELSVGIGSHASLIGGVKVTAMNGVDFLTIGAKVAW